MTTNGKLLEMHARQRLGMPGDWRVYNWESLLDDSRQVVAYQLTGAVIPIGKMGARLGSLEYHQKVVGTIKSTVIYPADHEAWVKGWEARTGLCRACLGSGKEMGTIAPQTFHRCQGCQGSGKLDGRAA